MRYLFGSFEMKFASPRKPGRVVGIVHQDRHVADLDKIQTSGRLRRAGVECRQADAEVLERNAVDKTRSVAASTFWIMNSARPPYVSGIFTTFSITHLPFSFQDRDVAVLVDAGNAAATAWRSMFGLFSSIEK